MTNRKTWAKNSWGLAVATSIALGCGLAQAAAVENIKVISAGDEFSFQTPDVATDSRGHVHIVAQGLPAGSTNGDDIELYYFRVTASGKVLNGPVQVNDTDTSREGRPAIAVTSDNKAIVVWRDGSSEPIKAALLNPAAGAGNELEISEIQIGVSTRSGELDVAVDSNDRLHVVFPTRDPDNCCTTYLGHIRVDAADLDVGGTNAVPFHFITTIFPENYPDGVRLALDSDDNLHAVFEGDGNGEISYAMLDSDGAVLIDESPLDSDVNQADDSHHYSIWAEPNGNIGVTYGDFGDTGSPPGAGLTRYVRLDPSKAAQDGSSSSFNELAIQARKVIASGGLYYSRGHRSADGNIHVFTSKTQGYGPITYLRADATGAVNSTVALASDGAAAAMSDYRIYPAGSGNVAVWTQAGFLPTAGGEVVQLVMSKVRDGGGGGGGSLGLAVFPLFAGAVLLRRRKRVGAA